LSHKSIQFHVLEEVVAKMGRTFVTKDVSEDPRMIGAHPDLNRHHLYHSFVGRALSEDSDILGIVELRKNTSGGRGSRWEKNGLVQSIASAAGKLGTAVPNNEDEHTGIGPQYKGDSAFAARMRRHQSWYRANVLHLHYGKGPTSNAATYYGNMLTANDAAAGRNFLTPEIAQTARDRVAQGSGAVEPFRLFHNMLSSQPMCFNLFGPLANDLALAHRLLSPIVAEDVGEVTRVALEWAPEPANAYLGDRTAFDAFIEYRTTDGRLCALGIETKLTESFSANEYDGDGYRRWMRVADAPWRPDAVSVHAIQHNQLWRDHLLSVALRHQPNAPYATTRLMLVRHPEDRDCGQVVSGYRKLLRDNDESLIDMPLDRLVEIWTSVVGDGPLHDWIKEFHLRYLELEKSQCR